MNVAHFVHRYPPALGGSEAYFARLSEFLVAAGHRVTVFTTTADELSAFWDRSAQQFAPGIENRNGVEVRRLPIWHLPVGHRYVLKAFSLVPVAWWQALTAPFSPVVPALWNVSERFDLVHAAAFPYSFPLACAGRLARRLGVPFFLTPFVHTGDPHDSTDAIRRAYTTPALLELARQADRIFVQTEGERHCLADRGIASDRLNLQGLGVDTSDCTGGDRGVYGSSLPVIGHLANHSREKGTIDLLEAANIAWAEGAKFELLLAGPRMPGFEVWQRSFSPLGRVRMLGPLDRKGKRDFFAALDGFALPSRSDSFGLVILEAWANGVPVVVYEAGGPPWIVRDKVDGLVVRCGDLRALAKTLTCLPNEKQMGEKGRSRLVEFDWPSRLNVVAKAMQETV
ncbi:MAG: glycosyltransferase family 1 protein [Planctomycetia bacterium]|nr:glycosyltransferase family 1 protein [Planctomycetia bacterium]